MNLKFNIIQNGYTICPENWGTTKECSTFFRMYYIRGGEAYFKQNEEEILLEKDTFYILPTMVSYTLRHNKDNPLEVLWFHVEIEMGVSTEIHYVRIEKNTVMYHLLNAMVCLHKEKNNFDDIGTVFEVFLRKLDENLGLYKYCGKRMGKVVSYIEEHIQENPSVNELAEAIGMERSYFSRFFKVKFGMSPSKFIYTRKMSVGIKVLLEGKTVTEAAAFCGYSDEKAFTRAFKKYVGVSPAEYKKSHIEQP